MATLTHPSLKRKFHATEEGLTWLLDVLSASRKGHRVEWSAAFIEALHREIKRMNAEATYLGRQLDAFEGANQ